MFTDSIFFEEGFFENSSVAINANIRLEVAGENALMLYFTATDNPLVESSLVDHHSNDLRSNEQSSTKQSSTEQPSSKPELSYSCSSKQDKREISPRISSHVYQAAALIRQNFSVEVIDIIPSYASILVMFNLLETDHHQLRIKLKKVLMHCNNSSSNQGRLIELPAYYSSESGMDLARIAKHANLSIEEVIALHQTREYQVYAIGFAPGFAYLGEVDERIAMPRLPTARLKVPKGAIAIADRQTAVYPAESPGGWNIIGLCPLDMFNAEAEPTMPVEVGDRVKFVAIDKQEFLHLGGTLAGKGSEELNKELSEKYAEDLNKEIPKC